MPKKRKAKAPPTLTEQVIMQSSRVYARGKGPGFQEARRQGLDAAGLEPGSVERSIASRDTAIALGARGRAVQAKNRKAKIFKQLQGKLFPNTA